MKIINTHLLYGLYEFTVQLPAHYFFKIWRLYVLGVMICGLYACSLLPAKSFVLLPANENGSVQIAQQQWQLNDGEKTYTFQVVIERGHGDWQWIMLNQFGQRVATASMKARVLKIDEYQSHPANKFIPQLLEALEFSYWPLNELQQAGQARWVFTEYPGRREVYFSAILRATIEYQNENPWQGSLNYKNSDFQLLIHSQLLN